MQTQIIQTTMPRQYLVLPSLILQRTYRNLEDFQTFRKKNTEKSTHSEELPKKKFYAVVLKIKLK